MYRIGEILEQALLLHECVVLPTLGALIVESTPPQYHPILNQISPIGQRISFNPDLKDREGILDSLYARHLKLSARRARIVVDADIQALRQALYHSGMVTLSKTIGSLSLQDSGALLFTPAPAELALRAADAYGLYTQTCLLPRSEDLARVSAIGSTDRLPSESKYWTIKIHRTAVNWVAAVAVCILCLFPITSPKEVDRYIAGFEPFGWIVSKGSKSEVGERHGVEEEQPTEELVSLEALETLGKEGELLTLAEARTKGNYAVVTASFRSKRHAEQSLEEHVRLYGGSYQILQTTSRYMVVAGICLTEEIAQELRRAKVEQNEDFSGAWVYHF